MKKDSLIFNAQQVYYGIQPRFNWWQLLLINLGIGLITALIMSLF